MTARPIIPNPLTVARGGTGLQTVSSGRLLRGNGTGALTSGADLTFNTTAGEGLTAALGTATTDVGNRYTQTFNNAGAGITHERHVITSTATHDDSLLLDYWFGTAGNEASVFSVNHLGGLILQGAGDLFAIGFESGELNFYSTVTENFFSEEAMNFICVSGDMTFTPSGNAVFDAPVLLVPIAIGSLPAAGTAGRIRVVNDQLTAVAAKGVAPTAGGSVVCAVIDNGSAWVGI